MLGHAFSENELALIIENILHEMSADFNNSAFRMQDLFMENLNIYGDSVLFPSFSNTRWIIIYEVLDYFVEFKEGILHEYQTKNK